MQGITIAAILTSISLILTTLMWLTNIYGNAILKLVSIRNDIDMVFELWRVPPTRPTLSVYIFNYTNHRKVLEGKEKPHVQEVGPYVFREKMERINVIFNPNGTVSFQENRTIEPDMERTSGSMLDRVIVPNVPLITVLKTVNSLFYLDQRVLTQVLNSVNSQPFQNLSVNEFIWGYEDAFFKIVKKIVNLLTQEDTKGFGFLDKRRGVHHDVVTMHTGEYDLENIGQITRWSGQDRIGCWGDTKCDQMTGSDGSIFPARATKDGRPMYIYSHSMCRRLPLHFAKTTLSKDGFPVQEYNVAHDLFDFSHNNTENQCYQYKGAYPPSGVFNTGPCQNDRPIYVSFPHFWKAGHELKQSISGLMPEESRHKSYFQIHKKLGICLKAKTRFQMNIMLHRAKFVDQTSKLQNETIILPIGWLDYDSGNLPEHFVNVLHHLTFTAAYIEETLKWILVLFTLSCLVYFAVNVRRLIVQPS
ncbi:lysosome membrane protein 2-like isoform X2 [Rhodnius prolixus]|uniref:lysosome membrane protein 2-like isoform X2 n=1 Tax=Rhodnius prolixus TaxID=13249 RepID=UPI003D18F92C